MDMTVDHRTGERASASTCYLRPAMQRPNLTVRTECRARRVVLDGGAAGGSQSGAGEAEVSATGVEVVNGNGQQETIHAGEVVLCLGAIQSPQLLMLSGIGPADHLADVGVPLAMHQPEVGQNLHDHLDTYIQRILAGVAKWWVPKVMGQ